MQPMFSNDEALIICQKFDKTQQQEFQGWYKKQTARMQSDNQSYHGVTMLHGEP